MAGKHSTKRSYKTIEDLTGRQFANLIALNLEMRQDARGRAIRYWFCRCKCGNHKSIRVDHLINGKTISCNCHRRELKNTLTHGRSKTKEYRVWTNAKTRCLNAKCKAYPLYGGRGITMSQEWINSFEQFFADMGPCPKGMSLDRIDVNGPYSKDNCRWVTHLEQMHNQRKHILVTYENETLPLWEWSARSGIRMTILYGRHYRGLSILGPRIRRWGKKPI